jgi:hypothetical protein
LLLLLLLLTCASTLAYEKHTSQASNETMAMTSTLVVTPSPRDLDPVMDARTYAVATDALQKCKYVILPIAIVVTAVNIAIFAQK